MHNLSDGIINSCRICTSDNQDNDFEHLYNDDDGTLSECGKLYEELIGMTLTSSDSLEKFYPRYLCNSCDLQMRLFKKLKLKANKTLKTLEQSIKQLISQLEDERRTEQTACSINIEHYNVESDEDRREQTSCSIKTEHLDVDVDGVEEYLDIDVVSDINLKSIDHLEIEELLDEKKSITTNSEAELNDDGCRLVEVQSLAEQYEHSENTQLTNLYSEHSENSNADHADSECLYLEIDYLEDVNSINTTMNNADHETSTKRSRPPKIYHCYVCKIEFSKRSELIEHRKNIHFNKFACPKCPKLLQTGNALNVHMKLHEPATAAYECKQCQKTFNQKVHYKYHMDKHNNIRNHSCDECDKKFLSKSDLTMHKRSHSGHRPYTCEICGKDFILLQHLKMHRYSHYGKSIECEVCKQKFTSPSTLRTHIQLIHNKEPQFQCEFCIKRFRRKHNLVAHYKVHQKLQSHSSDYLNETEQLCLEDKLEDDLLEVIDEPLERDHIATMLDEDDNVVYNDAIHDNDLINDNDTLIFLK